MTDLSQGHPASQLAAAQAAMDAFKQAIAATAVARDQAGGTALAERQLLRESGLLTSAVPRQFGGQELAWPDILRLVRSLAEVDSSLAHLLGFQHLQVASVLLFASPTQQEKYLTATVKERWFWGNAVNARDTRLGVEHATSGYVLNGVKGFCSGAQDSDVLNVSFVIGTAPTDRLFAVIPTDRAGITVNDDWDNMGQRQTDSGTVEFNNVAVHADDVLGPPGVASSPRATLRNLIGQLVLTEIYLGNARGALLSAVDYLQTQVQPWPMAGVERAVDDTVIQIQAGNQWIELQAAEALADRALDHFQRAWDAGDALTADERSDVALAIAAARVHAGRVALQITSEIFELVGARSTARKNGLDRFWRNVRVHTLHDPLEYRKKAVGRWLLTGLPLDPFGYG